MKKMLSIKYFFLSFFVLLACNQPVFAKPVTTKVRGKVYNGGTQSVALYKVENGELVRLAFRWPGKDGSFSFSFPLEEESIFFIARTTPHADNFKHVLYVKPADRIELQLYSNPGSIDYDSCKIKVPNQETKLLQQWVNLFNPVCKAGQISSKRDYFFSLHLKLQSTVAGFKASHHTSNEYFNRLLSLKIDVDMDFARAAAFFYFNERMNGGYDSSIAHRNFYEPVLRQGSYCDALILNTDHGMQLLKFYTSLNGPFHAGDIKEFKKPSLSSAVSLICNDTMKGAFVIDQMRGIVSYEKLMEEIMPFEKYFLQAKMNAEYKKKKAELLPFAREARAYNFSLPDLNDKMVSLSDFKGKVVVLDMWAMWCAPCLAEKPYFQKMEEEFKNNKEIIFIGVSVDGKIKKNTWKQFITKRAWNGIELISDYDESLMKYYRIDGIPRFMIFDKQGKIVTVDAPRPSEPAFKTLIEETLQKKDNASSL